MSADSERKIPHEEASPDVSKTTICQIGVLERMSYVDALALQLRLHDRCASGESSGFLLLLEHHPVITLGVKRSSRFNVLASVETLRNEGIEVTDTDRGGDVTYHGPGQLVGYPILPLRNVSRDLHSFLRSLEDCIIAVLADFGLKGERNGPAGVWVDGRKICSIGVAVRKMVTYHGFALNVDPIMRHFSLINPCGLSSDQMTSMAELLGEAPDMDRVRRAYMSAFSKEFNLVLEPWCPEIC